MSDVRDILDLDGTGSMQRESVTKAPTKEDILGSQPKPKKLIENTFKRPEGMHREVYALLYSDNKDGPPLIPSDSCQGYKQMKAKLGRSKVRPWKWMPFTNPARKDGAIFYHWRRAADEGKDYPFARFNKTIQVPVYSDQEYQMHIHDDSWTRQETDHLFDLCRRFDLRWFVVHDRFDHSQYQERSVEDLKERYYTIISKLSKIRADPNLSQRTPPVFDADHERKRKEQLQRLFSRTNEQVEEEQYLIQELKKIELRKKEREKKAQDLQKLITAADNNTEVRRTERKTTKKKTLPLQKRKETDGRIKIPETAGIKFPDFKQSGVSLRSQRMKLPSSVGQKRTKAIEQLLDELGIPLTPMPTEEICFQFNELRSDMVLLYELKLAYANCEFELQTMRHQFDTLAPGRLFTPTTSKTTAGGSNSAASNSNGQNAMNDIASSITAGVTAEESMTPDPAGVDDDTESLDHQPQSPSRTRKISEIIDVVSTTPSTPTAQRKRRIEPATAVAVKKIKSSRT
ncbi:DNA methyltransferase 1-associated protein 1-like [Ptychodera flava]|uniref:DNA methyltransferase 1-associated protein 1-like n=1 Tax=Ptychodera flava TaxID=63121 RepID=UPI003969E96D